MSKTTIWNIIIDTLETVKTSLTPTEIWQKANELNLLGDFNTKGKTPWNSIAAKCYTHIVENGNNSEIIKDNSTIPTTFTLRKFANNKVSSEQKEQKESKTPAEKFHERELHPLLVAYAYSNSHFKARVKTIYHEVSKREQKGKNEWLHPDLVGVQFPFDEYKKETLEIQNHLSVSSIKLFSFEMKIKLDFSNLRECFFQAVSNSSWANEGYLVALHIDENSDFRDEIRRLNNAFGIGIIKLNPIDIDQSEILFPAKINTEIDWNTVDRLCNENTDFCEFLKLISEDCKLGKVKSKYDEVIKSEELDGYVREKRIE